MDDDGNESECDLRDEKYVFHKRIVVRDDGHSCIYLYTANVAHVPKWNGIYDSSRL